MSVAHVIGVVGFACSGLALGACASHAPAAPEAVASEPRLAGRSDVMYHQEDWDLEIKSPGVYEMRRRR
jgi:hypothetical protein